MQLNKDTVKELKSAQPSSIDLASQKRLLDLLKKPEAELTSEDKKNCNAYLEQLFVGRLALKSPHSAKAGEEAVKLKLAELEKFNTKQALNEEEQLMLDIMRQLILIQKFSFTSTARGNCNFTLVQESSNSSKTEVGLLILKDYNKQFNQSIEPQPDGTIELRFKSEQEAMDFFTAQAKLGREFKVRDASGNVYEAKGGKFQAVSQPSLVPAKSHTAVIEHEEEQPTAPHI